MLKRLRKLLGLRPISARRFEREYAKRSGITVKCLRSLGRIVLPCDCESEDCEGWHSATDITRCRFRSQEEWSKTFTPAEVNDPSFGVAKRRDGK